MIACVGEPVSWLALERFALGELDAARRSPVARHLGECPACRACLDGLSGERSLPELPPLGDLARAAAARRRRARLRWVAGSAAAIAAAAAILLLAIPDRDPQLAGVKGAAAPVVTLVRERAGEVVHEPRSFRRGDRFKVLLTCAVPEPVTVQVVVLQGGEAFRPLAPAEIRCGNRVALPGAFGLTGAEPAQICVGTACAALAPEPWL